MHQIVSLASVGMVAMVSERILGIVGCYSLSDMILYLIDRDESIDKLYVVNNLEGLRFIEKMREQFIEKDLHLIEVDEFPLRKDRGFSIVLWLNPEDLHNEPSAIQNRQSEILSRMSSHVDSVFFCYGLCRSSEQRIINLMKQATVPVTFLIDARGEIVDDCFAAILGGKQTYLEHIKKHKGTLFATTGYVEAWRRKYNGMDIESIVHEVEGLKHMFEALEYNQVLILDDGLGNRDSFEQDIRTFSRIFDLELATRKCQLTVFERSYDLAKLKIDAGRIFQPEGIMAEEPSISDMLLSGWLSRWERNLQSIGANPSSEVRGRNSSTP